MNTYDEGKQYEDTAPSTRTHKNRTVLRSEISPARWGHQGKYVSRGVANQVTEVAGTYKVSFTASSRTRLHTDKQQGLRAKQGSSRRAQGTNPSQCQVATSFRGEWRWRGGGGYCQK